VDLELIQVDSVGPDTAIYLQEKIALGECVVVLADRLSPLPNSRIMRTNFLGSPASFPQGPFVLAALLKCPVFFMGCIKRENRHHVYLDHYTDCLKLARKNREQDLQKIVDAYAASLEQHCLEAPLQWFNFYDFWQDDGRAKAAPSQYEVSN
jgi:predicted LPLAT superfamily acyltransferase